MVDTSISSGLWEISRSDLGLSANMMLGWELVAGTSQLLAGPRVPGAVIDDLVPGTVEAGGQHALGQRDPDRGRDALPERPGGHLARWSPRSRGVAVLRVPGAGRAELAEALELLERDVVGAE